MVVVEEVGGGVGDGGESGGQEELIFAGSHGKQLIVYLRQDF